VFQVVSDRDWFPVKAFHCLVEVRPGQRCAVMFVGSVHGDAKYGISIRDSTRRECFFQI
jgi:hypothetical protein